MPPAIAALLRPLASRIFSPANLPRWAQLAAAGRRGFSSDAGDPPTDAGFETSRTSGEVGAGFDQYFSSELEQVAGGLDQDATGGFDRNAGDGLGHTAAFSGGFEQDAGDTLFHGFSDEMVYGKLSQLGRNALKSDIVAHLECGLSPKDIKFEYNKGYFPLGTALVQFPSQHSFETAIKQISRKGRFFRLDKITRSDWDLKPSFDGKALLLQGVPRNAVAEDIERFLLGTNYDPSSFENFLRPGNPDAIKCSIVRFQTATDAMNTYCYRNRKFILNTAVTLRVLH